MGGGDKGQWTILPIRQTMGVKRTRGNGLPCKLGKQWVEGIRDKGIFTNWANNGCEEDEGQWATLQIGQTMGGGDKGQRNIYQLGKQWVWK